MDDTIRRKLSRLSRSEQSGLADHEVLLAGGGGRGAPYLAEVAGRL